MKQQAPVLFPEARGERALVLYVPVGPLGGDGVLMEESWVPGFLSSLPGFSSLSLLQHKLFLGGPQLIPVLDGAGHVLPQSVGSRVRLQEPEELMFCTHSVEASLHFAEHMCG